MPFPLLLPSTIIKMDLGRLPAFLSYLTQILCQTTHVLADVFLRLRRKMIPNSTSKKINQISFFCITSLIQFFAFLSCFLLAPNRMKLIYRRSYVNSFLNMYGRLTNDDFFLGFRWKKTFFLLQLLRLSVR